MGLLSIFKKSKYLSSLDFFCYTGDKCQPAFCIDLTRLSGCREAYMYCSPISTMINRGAQAMANGKWWIVDGKDNDVSEKYHEISILLKNPNPLQSFTEFILQMDAYRQIYGEVFILKNTIPGFGEISNLWVINPEYITINVTGNTYRQSNISDIIKSYTLTIGNNKETVAPNEILHIKDSFQNLSFLKNDLRGASRLGGLEYEIRNICQAQEAIYSLNKDRGAMGILSNAEKGADGFIPMGKSEIESIENGLRKQGLSEAQRKIIVTNAALKWQSMSFNVKDLMLFEGIKQNMESISNALDYPFGLLGNEKGETFNNKDEDKKTLYQDSVIPKSKVYEEKFSSFLGLEYDKIVIDFSHIECLMQGERERAESLRLRNLANEVAFRNGIITAEEWRLNIEMDEVAHGNTYANDQ